MHTEREATYARILLNLADQGAWSWDEPPSLWAASDWQQGPVRRGVTATDLVQLAASAQAMFPETGSPKDALLLILGTKRTKDGTTHARDTRVLIAVHQDGEVCLLEHARTSARVGVLDSTERAPDDIQEFIDGMRSLAAAVWPSNRVGQEKS